MLAVERIAKIMEMLNQSGFVRVEELMNIFNVSDMTIRRDLEKCEKNGLIKRCYGGAYLVDGLVQEKSFEENATKNMEEKEKIGIKCKSLVRPGQTIFIDGGTTTQAVAKNLYGIDDITAITCNLQTAIILAKNNVKTIIVGGEVHNASYSSYGVLVDNMMSNFSFDVSFVAMSSVDADFYSYLSAIDRSNLKKQIMRASSLSYLVVDSSKFYKKSLYRQCSLSEFTGVVTAREFNKEELAAMEKKEIKLIRAD